MCFIHFRLAIKKFIKSDDNWVLIYLSRLGSLSLRLKNSFRLSPLPLSTKGASLTNIAVGEMKLVAYGVIGSDDRMVACKVETIESITFPGPSVSVLPEHEVLCQGNYCSIVCCPGNYTCLLLFTSTVSFWVAWLRVLGVSLWSSFRNGWAS